jgi:hypothetical protein
MLNKNLIFSLAPLLTFNLISCGSKDEKKEEPTVVYGTMTLSDSKANTDNATVALTAVTACTRNADTGRVDVTISQGASTPSLTLAIKDYSSVAKNYTCKQAADNATSETDVGGKFESCMVSASVLSAPTATTLNSYSMYRETIAASEFTYAGVCSVDVTTASPTIAGTVNCTGLVQTMLKSNVRYPVDSTITANVQSDFKCNY